MTPPAGPGAPPHGRDPVFAGLDARPWWKRPAGRGLIVLGALTLAALVSAIIDRSTAPSTVGPSAYSRSALGHAALFRLFEHAGLAPTLLRGPPETMANPSSVFFVIEPGDTPEALETTLAAASARGPVVVVMPKWQAEASAGLPGRVDKPRRVPAPRLEKLAAVLGLEPPVNAACPTAGRSEGATFDVALPSAQVFPDDVGVFTCGDAGSLVTWAGLETDYGVLVVADPDLLNNHGLRVAQRADLVIALTRLALQSAQPEDAAVDPDAPLTGRVVIDEVHHGFGRATGFWARITDWPLILVPLHLALLALLILWAGVRRFGPIQALPPRGVQGSLALIRRTGELLAATRGSHTLLRGYLRLAVERAAHAWSVPPPAATDADACAAFDHLTARRARGRLVELLRDVAATERTNKPGEAMALARRIHAWKESLTHDR